MIVYRVGGAMIAAMCILAGSTLGVLAAETLHPIQTVEYDVTKGEMIIENLEHAAIAPEQVTHSARRKSIIFFLPHSTLQPTPKVVAVKNDPIVKSIRLDQRALDGTPAVRVEVSLYSSAPYIPFQVSPVEPGLKMAFSRDNIPVEEVSSTSGNKKADAQKPKEEPKPTPKPIAKPVTQQSVSTPPEPLKPIINVSNTAEAPINLRGQSVVNSDVQSLRIEPSENKLTFKASDKDMTTPNTRISESVLGTVPQDTFSVINDVFYDDGDGSLMVVSQKLPIKVERSFTLKEPNRYVVDLSPAVLVSKSLTRAVPQNNPNILNFRVGQLDDDTVRLVVQFTRDVRPVDISQWESNKVLKLTF